MAISKSLANETSFIILSNSVLVKSDSDVESYECNGIIDHMKWVCFAHSQPV